MGKGNGKQEEGVVLHVGRDVQLHKGGGGALRHSPVLHKRGDGEERDDKRAEILHNKITIQTSKGIMGIDFTENKHGNLATQMSALQA